MNTSDIPLKELIEVWYTVPVIKRLYKRLEIEAEEQEM